MSDSDESAENFDYYGKPLEPYDEDAFPKKKPISLEDQVATDDQGRRRFHGAFTGGFSAGFFNTVGSLEGWRPSEFKSSRSEKQEAKVRKPEDYMDDEDLGEFGIAPHMVQAKEGFSTRKKRKKETLSVGPIPGKPVLETLLEAGNETIGYLLLRNMGFKHISNDMQENSDDDNDIDIALDTSKKVYGCDIPKTYAIKKSFDNKKYEVPKIYDQFLTKPKDNTFGLDYFGLDKSHINLFQPSERQAQNLVIPGTSKRTTLNIQGQAFGVGAFEEEDDDIYIRDDMSRYDFELTSESKSKTSSSIQTDKLVYDMFLLSTDTLTAAESFPPPTIPHSFTGKYKKKKSRFEPVPSEEENSSERRGLNAEIRAKYLGEGNIDGKIYTASNWQRKKSKEELENEKKKQLNKLKKNEEFDDKQKKALDIAAQGFLFDRFVSGSKPEDPFAILQPVARTETEHGSLQMREAARMKMFGPLTRETLDWLPCALLCKRFNLPEPLTSECSAKNQRKRTKNLIFEFQKFDDSGPDLKAGLSSKPQDVIVENVQTKEIINVCSEDDSLTRETDGNKIKETILIKEPILINEANITPSVSVTSDHLNLPSVYDNATSSSSSIIEEIDSRSVLPPSDVMNKINISQNQDLFKAIFADSSDDESDTNNDSSQHKNDKSDINEQELSQRNELLKATVLSDELIPKFKPMKVGILTDIKFPIVEESNSTETEQHHKDNEQNKVEEKADSIASNIKKSVDLYGPKLPDKIIFKKPQSIDKNQMPFYENSEEWVEKGTTIVESIKSKSDSGKRDKIKKSKKHKKDKKHKSKHKHKKNKLIV